MTRFLSGSRIHHSRTSAGGTPGRNDNSAANGAGDAHMNKRFVAWAVLVMLSQGFAGCEQSRPLPNPVTPSPPPSPPPPPPLPPPQLAIDLTGNYTLTFEVGGGCEQIPKELRTRTYEAKIGYYKSVGSDDWFFAELTGSKFHSYRPVLIEVSANSVVLDLSDNVILEEPSPGAYLATAGVGAASIQPTELSTISASFNGYFNYCAMTSENQCSVDTMVHGLCRSENSRWTLTRVNLTVKRSAA
jgi:hypothetical protein